MIFMQNLKGTKTESNLLTAFSGESQANTKYTFYAAKARKDGYNQIADLFEETANNERAHAELWFKYLHDSQIPSTEQNLKDAIEGESFEWNNMYPEFERVAKEEGFNELAVLFKMVGEIESAHEERYKKLLSNVQNNLVFSKDSDAIWQCLNCGHIVIGKSAPLVCPVCQQKQSYFQIKAENY
jgi:rubrerythrin